MPLVTFLPGLRHGDPAGKIAPLPGQTSGKTPVPGRAHKPSKPSRQNPSRLQALRVVFRIWLTLTFAAIGSLTAAQVVTIGILATPGTARDAIDWQPTADFLSREIETHRFELRQFANDADLTAAAQNGEIDYIVTNQSSYINLQIKAGAGRIMTLVRYFHGRPYDRVGAVLFSRADRPELQTLRDLKGRSLLSVPEKSFAGWQAVWAEFVDQGMNPYRDLSELRFAKGGISQVVQDVLSGQVDVGVVPTRALEDLADQGLITLSDFQIINAKLYPEFPLLISTGLFPDWVFAGLPDMADNPAEKIALDNRITHKLLDVRPDLSMPHQARVHGWTVSQDYQPVREVMQKLRLEPYQNFGLGSLSDIFYKYRYWITALALLMLAFLAALITAALRNAQLSRVRGKLLEVNNDELNFLRLALNDYAMVSISDAKGKISYINDAFAEATEYSQQELLGSHHENLCDGKHPKAFFTDIKETVKRGDIWSGEIYSHKKYGGYFWSKSTLVPFMGKDGRLEKCVHINTDITKAKAAESQVHHFKTTLDLMDSAISMFWPDTLQFFYMNEAGLNFLGLQEEDIHNHTPMDVTKDLVEAEFRARLQPMLDGKTPQITYEVVREDARGRKTVRQNVIQLIRPEGEKPRFISLSNDITERRNSLQQITQLRSSLDLMLAEIYAFDAETLRFQYVSKSALDRVGFSEEAMLRLTPVTVSPGMDEAKFRARLQPLRDGSKDIITYESLHKTRAGDDMPVEITIQLVSPVDEASRYVSIVRDISERAASRKQIEQLKTTLEFIPDEVYMFWPESQKFFYANQAAKNAIDLEDGGIFAQSPARVLGWEDRSAFYTLLQQLISKQKTEICHRKTRNLPSGQEQLMETTIQLIKPKDQPLRFLATIKDISAQIDAERAQQRFKTTLDLSNDQLYLFHPDSLKFFYLNKVAMQARGWQEQEYHHKTLTDLFGEFDVARFRKATKPLVFGTAGTVTKEITGDRGEVLEVTLQLIEPSYGRDHFIAVVRDISERKQIEHTKAEFVSTVSHELRTPLTSIKGALGLIRAGVTGDLPEKLERMLDIAYSNADRLVILINDILDVAKIESGKMDFRMETLDLVGLAQTAIEANKGYGDNLGVTFKATGSQKPMLVMGDEDRLMQVMANLMSNAAKFSEKGAEVEIGVKPTKMGARIYVKDFGCGIPEKARASIFDKFTQADSSDRRQKSGTGLGLSIAKMIVETHGGKIGFRTVSDKGTTFYFDLPLLTLQEDAAGSGQDEALATTLDSAPDTHAKILVCEDDPDIATLLQMMLENAGYAVRIAKNAGEAKQLLSTEPFDGMTLDIGLPDQDGISLLQELRQSEHSKDLPVVIISANAAVEKNTVSGDAIGVVDWIQKPIDESRLIYRLNHSTWAQPEVKPEILHVEDETSISDVVAEIIGAQANITQATTLKEAKRLIRKTPFDLVLLDLVLPDGNGETLLPLLNKTPQNATPVIIFSAKDISGKIADSVRATLVKSQASNEDLLRTIQATIYNNKTTMTDVSKKVG